MGNDFYGFLGLAAKAGKCVYGAFACEKLVKSGKARLVISDCGLSDRSKRDVKSMCDYYGVPLIEAEPEHRAGRSCGKDGIMLIGITDEGFKDKLVELSICGGAVLG